MIGKRSHLVKIMVVVLLCFSSVFPIYSYLTDRVSVKGTFRISIPLQEEGCEVVLKEHKVTDSNEDGVYELGSEEVISNEYTVYPGVNIPKDPFVRVNNLKSEAYLYVEIVGESNDDFYWSVNDSWLETDLKGKNNGKVYAYKGNSSDVITIENIVDDSLLVNILSGVEEYSSGGIEVSDNFTVEDKSYLSFYGYLAQASGFKNYIEAYESCF